MYDVEKIFGAKTPCLTCGGDPAVSWAAPDGAGHLRGHGTAEESFWVGIPLMAGSQKSCSKGWPEWQAPSPNSSTAILVLPACMKCGVEDVAYRVGRNYVDPHFWAHAFASGYMRSFVYHLGSCPAKNWCSFPRVE